MRAYAYVAFTEGGHKRTGTVLADTEAHAAQELQTKGLFVSELQPRGQAETGSGTAARTGWRRARLNAELQTVLTRQMAVLLAAGMPIEAALDAVRQGGHPALDAVAAHTRAALMDGAALSEALAGSGAGFAPYFIASVRAGETAGDTAVVFGELADHMDSLGADKAQISTALVYPTFVAAVSLLVCAILMTTVAPEIISMFELTDRPLPELTRIVLGISDWVQANLWPLGTALGVAVVLWIMSGRIPSWWQARTRLFLRLPLVGSLMRRGAAVQYLRTLALVLSSRQPVLNATQSAGEVLVVDQFATEARAVSEAIRQGETLSQALARLSILPPVARQLVNAGEVSSRLGPMTGRAALMVENALSTERKRIAALLEPLLMMLVGVFVLTIVLAVLLPIFDLQSLVAG